MSVIRKIRANYPKNKLEIISITKDESHEAFSAAAQKQKMNWTHIFGYTNLITSYGDFGIPKVILINPKGKIIYMREEEKDYDLSYLTKLVSVELKH